MLERHVRAVWRYDNVHVTRKAILRTKKPNNDDDSGWWQKINFYYLCVVHFSN